MNIPKQLKVRVDSNSKNSLGFVTYIDETGKLRSEKSWNSWGIKELGTFENKPMNGFVIDGCTQRSSDWFGSGRSMFYIVHPLGFKFEITADNLLSLLSYHDVVKGRINGELILVWDSRKMSLIPSESPIFAKYSKQTNIVNKGEVSFRDLKIGNVYSTRDGKTKYVYYGHKYILVYERIVDCLESDGTLHERTDHLYGYKNYSQVNKRYELSTEKKHLFLAEIHKDYSYIECVSTKKLFETGNTKPLYTEDKITKLLYDRNVSSSSFALGIFETKPSKEEIEKYVAENTEMIKHICLSSDEDMKFVIL